VTDSAALEEYIRRQVELLAAQQQAQPATTRPAAPRRAVSTSAPAGRAPTVEPEQADVGARLELSPSEFDFKEVWQGTPAEAVFTIRNTGTGPLTVQTRSSCGCTVATKPESPVASGATTTFKITYNTQRPGAANKAVTVTTNDPTQRSVTLRVTGNVKPVVTAQPSDHISFGELSPDEVAQRTVKITTNTPDPLALRLREGQDLGPFTVELKEIEAGRQFELTVFTKPPLHQNANNLTVQLDTGNPDIPAVPVHVAAMVPPMVSVKPARLTVAPTASQPAQQDLTLVSRGATPVHITEITSDVPAVTWEILPPQSDSPAARTQSQVIRVLLPSYDELPAAGARLHITTDAGDEAFRRFDVAVTRAAQRSGPAPARAPARGHAATPTHAAGQ
jgi:hypothetical protein